jgi:hypothetical protein
MSSVPMIYVESDIPEGVTLVQWRAARPRPSKPSLRARLLGR